MSADHTTRRALYDGLLPPGFRRVAYRVSQDGEPPYSGQACLTVVPRARGRRDGPIGLYASHCHDCFAAMASAGFHWTNTLSSAGHFAEWTNVEPERGRFVFHDDDLALAREFGIHLIGDLDTTRSSIPRWVLQPKPGEGQWIKHPLGWFRLDDWSEFVHRTVEHYHNDVHHWLIMDEPDGGTNSYSAEDYARLLAASDRVIKQVDPEAVVFAHTGTRPGWYEQVTAACGTDVFDGLYTYIGQFNRDVGKLRRDEAQRLGKPLWTVDFGPVTPMDTGWSAVEVQSPPERDRVTDTNFRYLEWGIRSLSWGRAGKWFRYDARFPGTPPGARSYMTIWQHDGSLTPHGAALAMLNAVLAGTVPQGEVEMPEGVEGHLFAGEGRTAPIAWTTDGTVRELGVPVTAAWDCGGAPLQRPTLDTMPAAFELAAPPATWPCPVKERIDAELLPPTADGEPYRARFTAHPAGPASGDWVTAGPYFRERAKRQLACQANDGAAELVVPLNAFANLPLSDRLAEVRLFLPGRQLAGQLHIRTAD